MELLDFLLILKDDIKIEIYKSCLSTLLVSKEVHELDIFDFKFANKYTISSVVSCDDNVIKVIVHAKMGF